MRRGRHIYGDKKGATLVEFAFIAPVFLLIIVAVVEYSIYFFKISHLKHVLYEASRTIQTGEIQRSSDPVAAFNAAFCDDVVLIRCDAVYFDVRAYDSLGAINLPAASFNDQGSPTNFVFQPGGSGQITVMRISTPHRFSTPLMANVFGLGDKPAILIGQSIAQNEPF